MSAITLRALLLSRHYLDQPTLLLNPGEYGIPSEFYYDKENGILIGQGALDAGQGAAASFLVSEVKMAIHSGKTFVLDGREFTAEEIIKEIYKTLVSKAQIGAKKRSIAQNIEGVVISVPAKFEYQERDLIRRAATNCLGSDTLPIKAIIKEPVAAAISYYNKANLEDNKYILVYDLGGGTCDVALVCSDSSQPERYRVIDSDMVRIGGRNWDEELVKYLTEVIENRSGIKIKGNIGYEEKIRRTAIAVKHDLSDPLKERAIARVEINGRIYTCPVSRNVFDEITSELLNHTLDCLEGIYDQYSSKYKIDDIICVGGSSNMLQVEEGLIKRFPKCNIKLHDPEHAVVNGATICAAEKIRPLDISSFSYGTESNTNYGKPDNREIVSNILIKGTHLPDSKSRVYYPVVDGQKVVAFNIYESEILSDDYDISEPNKRLIGKVDLLLPPNSTTSLRLTCKIGLNLDGLLEVEASEPSGKKVSAEFKVNKYS